MLISTTATVALYCPDCGKIEFTRVSLFQFSGNKTITLKCSCGAPLGTLTSNSCRNFLLDVYCGMCTGNHRYRLNKKELWTEESAEQLYCEDTGLETGIVGSREAVETAIDQLESAIARLDCELQDDYFEDPEIMYQLLNVIYDMADVGKLYCKCGNTNLQLEILSDRIELNCQCCQASGIIKAATEEDVAALERQGELQLTQKGIVLSNMVSIKSKKRHDKKNI
ncbi:MAG: hypothetical protein H0Z35_05030 [Thermoanaerobacteraceae bacterium]|nr:hypothetical protein [Thermoanaerobacteraceae bacterium]